MQPIPSKWRTTSDQKTCARRAKNLKRPTTVWQRRLVVMVKEPRAGQAKTRLASGIGEVPAVWFYRHVTARVLSRVSRPSEWETILAVAPDPAVTSRAWSLRWPRIPQGHGNLGERMQRIMNQLPPGPVLIIGSDTPEIRAHHVRAAFSALGSHTAVIGPSPDGGYWLIGLKRRPRILQIFDAVRWSSPRARADTEQNLKRQRVGYAATLDDVDEAEDHMMLGAKWGRLVLPARCA